MRTHSARDEIGLTRIGHERQPGDEEGEGGGGGVVRERERERGEEADNLKINRSDNRNMKFST